MYQDGSVSQDGVIHFLGDLASMRCWDCLGYVGRPGIIDEKHRDEVNSKLTKCLVDPQERIGMNALIGGGGLDTKH